MVRSFLRRVAKKDADRRGTSLFSLVLLLVLLGVVNLLARNSGEIIPTAHADTPASPGGGFDDGTGGGSASGSGTGCSSASAGGGTSGASCGTGNCDSGEGGGAGTEGGGASSEGF